MPDKMYHEINPINPQLEAQKRLDRKEAVRRVSMPQTPQSPYQTNHLSNEKPTVQPGLRVQPTTANLSEKKYFQQNPIEPRMQPKGLGHITDAIRRILR